MPDVASASSFDDEIPALIEPADDEIPASLEPAGEADEIPVTESPDQTVVSLLSQGKTYSERARIAANSFDNPTLRPYFVKALAAEQKAKDSRSASEKAAAGMGAAIRFIPAVNDAIGRIVTETVPAVIGNIYNIAGEGHPLDSTPERARAYGEAMAAIQTAVTGYHGIVRKTKENLSDAFTFDKNKVGTILSRKELLKQATGQNPAVVNTQDEYETRAEADVVEAMTLAEAAKGALLPAHVRKQLEAKGTAIRPDVVGALSEAYDPQNVLEFGLGAAVGKAASKVAGKEIVATGLLKAAPVTEPGFAARAVSSVFGAAGEKLVKASDNPVIVGTLAGSAVALSGGDPTTVVLAAVLGAGSTRKSGMVSSALEKSGGALVRVGDQFAGRASLGPMGRFAEGALAFSKPALRGGGAGLVASAPFALGSRDEDDVLNTVAGGVAFGLGGGLVGSTYAKAADKFAIHNVFKSKADAKPDSAYERPEYTPYSPDSGHPLEVESKRVFDTLSNRGAQTVEVLKKLFSKPGEDGMKTEIYLGGQAAADAFAKSMGLDSTRAGVTIELPKEGRRVVFINADSNGGISLGHEVGHGFIESLPAAEKKQMVDTGLELLFKNGQFFTLRDRYAEKFNTVRDAAGNLVQKPKDQWVYREDEYYVKEYLAENFSAYLNGIPIEKFGTPRSLADRIRISIGSRLEKAGARKLTADGSAAVQTPLGYKPSAALAEMFDNFMQARKLENTTLPGETPPEVGVPPVLEKPEAKPATPAPAESVPAVTPEPAAVTPTPEATPEVAPAAPVDQAEINRRASLLRKAREQLALANELGANADVIAKAQERVAAQEAFFDAAFPAETPAPASTPAPATPKTTPTAEDLVAPKQVENVVRPEAPAPTPGAKSLRPKAADAFVEKATDEVHLQNRKDFEGLMSAPRGQIPVVEVTTRGAASPVESPDAVVRAAQRKAADALEKSGQPNPFRQAFQKLFVPYRWATYKLSEAVNARLYGKDAPRQPGGVYGMSVDKVGQNLDLLRGIALENPKIAETLARSGFDAAYLSSPEIVSDFRKYLENQANGFGGGGERLVRPADTRPGSITPEATGFVPNKLSPEKRQLFNLLLNFEQQSSRTAGMEFSARFAKQNGIDPLTVGFDDKGRPLTENNALRASLIKQGFDPRILNSAVENLPTENFTSPLKVRPDIKFPAADVAIAQAGFMPETNSRSEVLAEVERALRDPGYSDPGRSSLTSARQLLQDPTSDVADIVRKLDMARMYTSYSHPSRSAVYKAGQLASELGDASFMPETSSPRRPQGNDETRSVASRYAEKAGIRAKQHDTYAPADETTLKRIADFYEQAKHEPNRPEVEKAYRALAEETRAQYDEMVANGIKIEPFEAGKGEPYPNSAAMLADVRDNKHLYFFKTENAYGAGDPSNAPSGNALLEKSGIRINGHDLLYNDLFRAVHDYFGHTAEGFEFGPRGEYNAYLAHSRMFSDEAKPALAAETLAQNAWVNFGPQLRRSDGSLPKAGDVDFVPIAKRRFADQKNTVVPGELLRAADPQASFMPEAPDTPEFKKWFGDWEDPKAFTSRAKGPVSQVVDWKAGDKRPLRVYHATTEDFTTFESGRKTFDDMGLFGNVETNRHAIFFSDSPEQASSYAETRTGKPYEGAKLVPAYLDMKSPVDFTRRDAWDIAEEVGFNPRWTQYKQTWELFDGPDGKEFVEALKKEGYDGAIFTEDAVREGVTPGTTYAVFEPTQIKSATGNRGTFDPKNPDIRFMPEQLDAPEKLPHAVRNKTLTLVHKGTAGLSEIDPAKFGSSKITPRSELSGEPRSYYYVKGFENKSDPVMGRGTQYEIPVSGKRIYNGDADPLDWSQQINRQKADLMLKDAGYAGVIRTRGEGKNKFKQVELFEKVSTNGEPVSETDVRTPRSRLETPEGREVAARLREKYGSTGAYFDRLNKYKETGEISFMPESPSPAVQVLDELKRANFISDKVAKAALGEFPTYLTSVADFITKQREKLVGGNLTSRDVAKAYMMTVASQGTGAIFVDTIAKKLEPLGINFNPSDTFRAEGGKKIRPEEAAAWWLGTEDGKRALDNIEKGIVNPEDWAGLAEVRRAYGDDRFKTFRALDPKNLERIAEVTGDLNASKGKSSDVLDAVQKLNGISTGKKGFVSHLLGLGDTPTIDAVEINFWLTGKGDIKTLDTKKAELARRVKETQSDSRVSGELFRRIDARIEALRGEVPGSEKVAPEVWAHILHHWLWDKAKGLETTHEGMYKAQASFMPEMSTDRLPEGISPVKAEEAGSILDGSTEPLKEGNVLATVSFMPESPEVRRLLRDFPLDEEAKKKMVGKTGFAFVSDWADSNRMYVTSSGREVDVLRGGLGYTYHPDVINKGAWAGTFSALTDRVVKKINASDGIGLVVLGGQESSASSRSFSLAFLAEMRDAIAAKELKLRDADRLIAKAFKKLDRPEIKTLEDYAALIPKERNADSPDGLTFEQRDLVVREVGSAANSRALGLPNWNKVLKNYNVQKGDYQPGQIVSVVQFEKGQPAVRSQVAGTAAHPSYEAVLRGKPIGVLTEKVMIADFFKDFFTAEGTEPGSFTRKVQTKMPEFVYGEGSSVLAGRQLEDVTLPNKTLALEGISGPIPTKNSARPLSDVTP